MTSKRLNQCCAEEIKKLWDTYGGSMGIVRHETNCPKCGHYIGLTQTSEQEATEFLREYGLDYLTSKTMNPNMTLSFCSFPNECVFPNCNCADLPLKPTIKQQLAWLDAHGDNEIIRAIKENVIAVRNYEKALDDELRPSFIRDRDQAFKDLLAYGEAQIMTLDEFSKLTDVVSSNNEVNHELLKTYAEGEQDVEAYKEAMGFTPSERNLNLQWEHSVINQRIQKLQAELRFELSRKKQFRSQQVIDHCHTSINNLKKWKSQSL